MSPSLSLSACSNISLSSFLEYLSPTCSEILSKSSNLINPSLSVSNYLKRSANEVSSFMSDVNLKNINNIKYLPEDLKEFSEINFSIFISV